MYKILIVDDILTNRVLLSQTLLAFGNYDVVEAVNGKDAISQFEKEKPDLVLMDIMMPDIDGCEATTIIKSKMGDDYTPIIFITALSSEDSLSTALSAGGDDFISKPFHIEILESKIKAHLRIRELNQQLNEKNDLLINHNQHLINEQELIEYFFNNAIKQSFLDENIIRYHMSSMSSFNGDLLLVERAPTGGLYLILGDFSGHGLSAAMGTLPVAMIFFKLIAEGSAVGDIAREINLQLNKLMPSGMFFTATILELNVRSDILSVWMGGMPENYLLNKNGELKQLIHSQHMPLGILSDNDFDSSTQILNVETEDKIYLYSDGVIEAKNSKNEQFGDDRLKNVLTSKADNCFDAVLTELNDFSGNKNQNDDITLVELTCCVIPPVLQKDQSIHPERALPWHISVTFSVEDMRALDPVKKLTDIVCAIPYVSRHKGVIYVLLFEIYSNALDHGILKIESVSKTDEEQFAEYYQKRDKALSKITDAFIDFNFNFIVNNANHYLEIQVEDSGGGFEKENSKATDGALHGRGMGIISNLCESVSFSDNGKVMTVLYKL